MTRHKRIYLLSPQNLKPETIAVAFAKTSRSPKPFDEIAEELTDEGSAQFHEKWVVGYGHASVAEHAVLHIALENVSRLAIETVEANRLASYTEKSTRYQVWEVDAFHLPEEIQDSQFKDDFIGTSQLLFETYQELMPVIKAWMGEILSRNKEETERGFQRRVQSDSADVCRFLLPAASLANVGVTINARSLEYAICKMLSSPLVEVRAIGEQLLKVGQEEAPTLIKYAGCNDYLMGARDKLRRIDCEQRGPSTKEDFKLLDWDEAGQEKVLAGILFRFGAADSVQAGLAYINSLSFSERNRLAGDLMLGRSRFDQPLREFEYAQMTFEVTMDQGAYFEFKRHRMMTQTVGPLTAALGFAVPKAVVEAGCLAAYQGAMRKAASLYAEMARWNPDAAAYIIPNGFNRRVMFTLNLREAFHLCRLRAAHNAHFSIRRVALQIAETINEIYPIFGPYLDIPPDQSSRDVDEYYFSNLHAA
jgi:thymidylate synthase ThyX